MKKIAIQSFYIIKAGNNHYNYDNAHYHYHPSPYDDALKKGQVASIGGLIGLIICGPVGAFIGAVQGFYMASLSSRNHNNPQSQQYYESLMYDHEAPLRF
ncbi:DUF456 domain-containing protein [bacterium]|jgi:hypothetical protein|nr:DUF456 domain-containing protein [bacterium]NBX71810.1 DUF456 domain-containing protein [bacterium]